MDQYSELSMLPLIPSTLFSIPSMAEFPPPCSGPAACPCPPRRCLALGRRHHFFCFSLSPSFPPLVELLIRGTGSSYSRGQAPPMAAASSALGPT